MGTRHLIAVFYNGEYKIAQYGQWDGYPFGQGIDILRFLKRVDLNEFKKKLNLLSFFTDAEYSEIIKKHTDNGGIALGSEHEKWWAENMPQLSRDLGAGILDMVYNNDKPLKLRNNLSFAGDSLFCEWAYIIDMDKGVFEIYEGFNEKRITNGRFKSDDPILEKTEGYEPVILVKTYKLDNLPNEKDFINELGDD